MTADTLNPEQSSAIASILLWLADSTSEPFYLLRGYAGTGKTFTIRQLVREFRGRLIFTAPTNKATRVLRDTLTSPEYKPDCKTIYSLLGLKLEANGEIKELRSPDPEDEVDLSAYRCVIVDEGSMVNEQLRQFIHRAVELYNIKFLFLGDDAQLPPVGESKSPIWRIKQGSALTQVMRHDNEILRLATHLREIVDHPAPPIKLQGYDRQRGVTVTTAVGLRSSILEAADEGAFSRPNDAKAIAWRNVTVDALNKLIRARIFPEATAPWLVGDRVLFASPARDLEDKPMTATDDEGEITRTSEGWHPEYGDFKIWNLTIVLDDSRLVIARVLHADSAQLFADRLSRLADSARLDRRAWRLYWEFKDAFHTLKYAYAITAHRSQGSTYQQCFVDYRDILINRTKAEAMRCLYVAATRAKTSLVLG